MDYFHFSFTVPKYCIFFCISFIAYINVFFSFTTSYFTCYTTFLQIFSNSESARNVLQLKFKSSLSFSKCFALRAEYVKYVNRIKEWFWMLPGAYPTTAILHTFKKTLNWPHTLTKQNTEAQSMWLSLDEINSLLALSVYFCIDLLSVFAHVDLYQQRTSQKIKAQSLRTNMEGKHINCSLSRDSIWV